MIEERRGGVRRGGVEASRGVEATKAWPAFLLLHLRSGGKQGLGWALLVATHGLFSLGADLTGCAVR
jgi:hypothetical protein